MYALPGWNECANPDGHVMKHLLETAALDDHEASLLLREASQFGFGSLEIFKILLSKTSKNHLQFHSEDLILDTFLGSSLPNCTFDTAKDGMITLVATVFDPVVLGCAVGKARPFCVQSQKKIVSFWAESWRCTTRKNTSSAVRKENWAAFALFFNFLDQSKRRKKAKILRGFFGKPKMRTAEARTL